MNITVDLICLKLSTKYTIRRSWTNGLDREVKCALFYRGCQLRADTLYLAGSAEEIPEGRRDSDTAVIIYIGNPSRRPAGCNWIHVQGEISPQTLMNDLQMILCDFRDWAEQVEHLVQKGKKRSLLRILEISEEYSGLSMALVDYDFTNLGYTQDFMRRQGLKEAQVIELEAVNDLVLDPLYQNATKHKEPFLYARRTEAHVLLCYNIKRQGKDLGRLLSLSADSTYASGHYDFIRLLGRYMGVYANNELLRDDQRQSLYVVVNELIDGRLPDQSNYISVLDSQGWHEAHSYVVCLLRFLEADRVGFSLEYYRRQLEDMFTGSIALFHEDDIVLVINSALLGYSYRDIDQNLALFLRETMCRAGISENREQLSQVHLSFTQALWALKIGEAKNDMRWSFHFSDYCLDFLLQQCTTVFPGDQVCHPALKKLRQYDLREGTELFETLYIYIDALFNATHAAKRLCIHRTTFLYRLQRIMEIAAISSFDSWELRLHLMLSFALLKKN